MIDHRHRHLPLTLIGLHLIADEWSRDSTMILAEETVNHCHDKESPLVVEHRQLSRHSLVATASQSTLVTGGERNDSDTKHMSTVHKSLEAGPTGYCQTLECSMYYIGSWATCETVWSFGAVLRQCV